MSNQGKSVKKQSKIVRGLLACVVATTLLPAIAMASAVDQFKSFVSNTKSAKGEFVQQQIKMVDGNPKVSKTFSGAFVFARPGNSSGLTKSLTSKCCRPMVKSSSSLIKI
jgi:hypothetical protein